MKGYKTNYSAEILGREFHFKRHNLNIHISYIDCCEPIYMIVDDDLRIIEDTDIKYSFGQKCIDTILKHIKENPFIE